MYMKIMEAVNILDEWDSRGRYFFNTGDLAALLGERGRTLEGTLRRLRAAKVLESPVRGVYLYRPQRRAATINLEAIARVLRRSDVVYESLESALSQWGAISQIPMSYLSVMTTGREGTYRTPYGTLELTHTARAEEAFRDELINRPGHLIPIASPRLAYENLRDTRRNIELVDMDELEEIIEEHETARKGEGR